MLSAQAGLNGAAIDGQWYLRILGFVQETPWLHGVLTIYAEYGLVLFALLMVAAWWVARRGNAVNMAATLWSPLAVVLAYLANDLVKSLFAEPRPCIAFPHVVTLLSCGAPNDWSFPSNHAAIAGAAAVALWVANRRIGIIATVIALLMAFSRVYVGAHYPHDVIIGLILGGLIGLTTLLIRVYFAGLITRLRNTRLSSFLASTPADG